MNRIATAQNAPRCQVHLATEMTLMEVTAPAWLLIVDEDEDETAEMKQGAGGYYRGKNRTRKFWKCPVAGCRRVSAHLREKEEAEAA